MALSPVADLRWLFFGMSGRLGRGAYFQLVLFWFCVFAIPVGMAIRVADSGQAQAWVGFALIAVFIAGIWSVTAASVKRLHDLDVSSWFTLVLLVPGLIIIVVPALCIWPARQVPNRFGSRPDAPGH